MDTTLVVMAAGMGSRFGGLKQIEPMGLNGEVILDFSVYDAKKAGFNKVVFIIKKEIEKDFREVSGKRIEKMMDTHYVFQEIDSNLPQGFNVPDGRIKPWGTAHAILCAKDKVSTPFCAINADDYYGKDSFKLIHQGLVNGDNMCLAGFKLKNTITENGTVSRGVCEIKDGFLKSVVEHTALDKNSPISMDTIVSMNMWGFGTSMFDEIEKRFETFLNTMKNPLKDEFYLPFVVDELIKKENQKVRAYESNDKWYGVTYKEDTPDVKRALQNLMKEGYYDGI